MSRFAVPLLLAMALLLFPGAAGADGIAPESRAEIKVEARRTKVYVGEVVELTLEIWYDGPWFEKHAAALFRQPMYLPLRAVVPAFEPRDGLRAQGEHRSAKVLASTPTFGLGDEVVPCSSWGEGRLSGSRNRRLVALARRFHVTREGVIDLAAPSLEFAWAERFEPDLLGVRTPVNPLRVTILGSATQLTVLPVPAEGRPTQYHGLIGRYALAANADRTALAVGEALRLTLTITGQGNHETLPVPGFEGLDGFHLLGTLDEQTPKLRTLRMDLVALDANTREIPALTLAYFDPERGSYDVARSEPIPLTVHGASSPQDAAPTVAAPPPPPAPATSRGWLLPLALGLLALLGVGFWLQRRRARALHATKPDGRLETLLARLRGAAGTPEGGQALIDVLAWQLAAAPAAVVTPDLAMRLVRSGLPAPLAQRSAAAVEAGVAARYAGSHEVAETLPMDLIADLEHALRPQRPA